MRTSTTTLRSAAHRLEGALLEHPQQLGLGGQGQIADLVQQQGPPVGHLEAAGAGLDGPGEGASGVPEQLALQEVLGEGRAVELEEGLVDPSAPFMDGPGQHLLARAGLAADEHRRIRGRHLSRQAHGPLHGGAVGALDEAARVLGPHHLRAQQPVLRLELVALMFEAGPLLRGHPRQGDQLAVDGGQGDGEGIEGAAGGAVEGEGPEGPPAPLEGHHHAAVAVGKIQNAVVGIAVAFAVVGLEHHPGDAAVQRLPHAGEAGERDAVGLHPVVRQGAPGADHAQAAPVQPQHRRQVVGHHPGQGVQGRGQEVRPLGQPPRHVGQGAQGRGQIGVGGLHGHRYIVVPPWRPEKGPRAISRDREGAGERRPAGQEAGFHRYFGVHG